MEQEKATQGDRSRFGMNQAEAKKRGRESIRRAMIWTMKWGWTFGPVLRALIGVERKIEYQLVNNGALEKIDLGRRFPPVFVLGKRSLTAARQAYEDELGEAAPFLPYGYNTPANIPLSRYDHELQAQLHAIECAQDDPLTDVYSERELSAIGKIGAGARPDFTTGGGAVWHEIEINGKYAERLVFQLYLRHLAVQQGRCSQVVFHCASRGVAKNIARALHRPAMPKVEKLPGGKIVHSGGQWSPDTLRSRVLLRLLDGTPVELKPIELEDDSDPMADL